MKYFKKVIGGKCYLSPINIEDAERYSEWLNNIDITKFLAITHHQISEMKEKEILTEMIKQGSQIFAIVDLNTNNLIGNCSLFDINHRKNKAELGIFIGDKNYLGKGFGTEAIKLILDYGFNILNLHNIMLSVYSYNQRAIAAYTKAGFKEFGRRRDAHTIAGKRYDEIYMDILDDEFESIYFKGIMKEI
ncbi:MAG: GNAT family protein [Candidatus Tenebribacter davisii]|nr:GNAT family protein [Candidatus Tenebribacter davisii]